MSKFLEEFKAFAMRGNVMDMAVGVVIGGAFGKIVSSLVADLVMPPIGLLVGGVNFTELKLTLREAVLSDTGAQLSPAVTLNYGSFLQTALDFIIIALAVFVMIRLINRLHGKKKAAAEAPATPPTDVQLLSEIRDLLKNREK